MAYEKPWSSYESQLDQLIARGMVVTDRARAIDCLERIGPYRFQGLLAEFPSQWGLSLEGMGMPAED